MIPNGVEIFVSLDPVDLRWGFDRLAGFAEERVGHKARSGALFLFFGKRRTALKALFYDGSGMCLFYKRLDKGTFKIPESHSLDATSVVVDEREFHALLDGIDVEAPVFKRRREPKTRVH